MDQQTPTSLARADRQAEQRRRILDAAIACFARGGFHATGMQAVCAEAGMSPGGLYRYFRSKEAIIEAIVERDRAAIPAMQNLLRELKKTGSIAHMRSKVADFKLFTDIAGLPEIQELEKLYGLPEGQRAAL